MTPMDFEVWKARAASVIERLKTEGDQWRADFETLKSQFKDRAEHYRKEDATIPDARALSTFLQPDLGLVPSPLRSILQPLAAALALSILTGLVGLAAINFASFALVASLIYLMITKVFGIHVDMNAPAF